MYDPRIIDQPLKDILTELPAVLVEGAKAVGKTETCLQFAKTNYSLDNETEKLLLTNDPNIILKDKKPILLDEWQYAPELWTFVRHQVDNGVSNGSFLFSGSSIRINSKIHGGAGRIVRLKLRPYSIQERQMSDNYIHINELFDFSNEGSIHGVTQKTLSDYLGEIFKSGFPGIRKRPQKARELLLQSYIDNIIDHDFAENGFTVRKPASLLAWLKSYAASIGTTTKFQTIIDSATANGENLNRTTANDYREALEILYIIDEVPAFLGVGKLYPNLAKSPKHYMLDPAIALKLLGVDRSQLVDYQVPKHVGKFNQTFIGQLLESLVYQSLIVYADANNAILSHFRDHRGFHEIDFILQKGDSLILFEVKSSANAASDQDVRHLNWFEDLVKDDFKTTKVLLNTGQYAYTRQKDHVHVLPIAMLGV